MGMFDDMLGDTPASGGGMFDDLLQPQRREDQPWDITVAAKRGVQKLPGTLVGLGDAALGLVGADRPLDKLTDKIGEQTGFQPGKWADDNQKKYSPELQEQMRQVDSAWGDDSLSFTDKLKATVQHPGVLGAKLVESIPGTLAGGVAGRGIAAASGISRLAAGAIGEGAMSAGSTMDDIPDSVDPQKAAFASAASGTLVGGLGVIGGRIAQRLGISDVDTMLAGGGRAAEDLTAPMQKNLYTRFIGAALQEGVLEEMPQSVVEQMASNFAQDKPLFLGVDRAATEGALLGAAMGGGASMLGTSRSTVGNDETTNTTPLSPSGAVPDGTVPSARTGNANDQLQENGSPNRLDPGTDQSDMGLHGQREAVSAGHSNAGGSGNVGVAGIAGSDNAGEGTNVPALSKPRLRVHVPTEEGGKPRIEVRSGDLQQLEKDEYLRQQMRQLQTIAQQAGVPPTGTPATNAQQPAPAAAAPSPVPAPVQLDPNAFDASHIPEPEHGYIGAAVKGVKAGKSTVQQQGVKGALKNLEDRITQNFFDMKHGALRYLPMEWTTDDGMGGKRATPRAKFQAEENAYQIAADSIPSGYVGFNKEGMPQVFDSPSNFKAMYDLAHKFTPRGKHVGQFVNGLMNNLTYLERETKLNDKKQAAAREKPVLEATIQAELQKPNNYDVVKSLQTQLAAVEKTLSTTYERPDDVTDDSMQQAIEWYRQNPDVHEFVNMHRELNYRDIDLALNAGKISQAVADDWKTNLFYSDLHRVMLEENDPVYVNAWESMQSNSAGRDVSKKFRGSGKRVNDFFENAMMHRMALADSAIRNNANMSVMTALENIGVAERHVERPKGANNVVELFDQGKRAFFTVDDPLAYRSFQALDKGPLKLLKPFEKVTHFFRESIMLAPDAMFRNAVRDAQETWIYNYTDKTLPGVFTDTAKRIGKEITRPSNQFNGKPEVVKFGIGTSKEQTTLQREINRAWTKTKRNVAPDDWAGNAASMLDAVGSAVYHRWENVAMSVEAGTREHIYQEVLKRTGSTTEAQMAAQNLLDFRRRGDNIAITFLKQTVPFVNSSLQGLHKIYRAMAMNENLGMDKASARRAMATKGIQIAAMAGMYTMLMLGGDEEDRQAYLQVDKKIRDTSILVKIPGAEKGTFLRIPLPFELGSAFWSMPANLAAQALGHQTGKDTYEALKYLVSHSMVNPAPQLVKPVVEAATNHDSFTDSNIVPASKQSLPTELQVRDSTTNLARGLSSVTDISPLKIDHMLRGYFGSLGQYVLGLSDAVINKATDNERAAMPVSRYPMIKSLLTDPLNIQATDDLYKMRDTARQVDSAVKDYQKRFDRAGLESYLEKKTDGIPNKKLYSANPSLNAATDALSKMHAQQQAIARNKDIDSKERRIQMDQLKRQENAWVKQYASKVKSLLEE